LSAEDVTEDICVFFVTSMLLSLHLLTLTLATVVTAVGDVSDMTVGSLYDKILSVMFSCFLDMVGDNFVRASSPLVVTVPEKLTGVGMRCTDTTSAFVNQQC
jgi:hypothetical protein